MILIETVGTRSSLSLTERSDRLWSQQNLMCSTVLEALCQVKTASVQVMQSCGMTHEKAPGRDWTQCNIAEHSLERLGQMTISSQWVESPLRYTAT